MATAVASDPLVQDSSNVIPAWRLRVERWAKRFEGTRLDFDPVVGAVMGGVVFLLFIGVVVSMSLWESHQLKVGKRRITSWRTVTIR